MGKKGTLNVFGSVYSPSEAAVVYSQIFDDLGDPANGATVKLTLFEKDGTKILDSVTMTYITNSNGLYKYEFTAPSTTKRMVADVASENPTAYGSEDIYVSKFAEEIVAILEDTQEIEVIKGAGWSNETLRLIKELVDELETGEKPYPKAKF